MVASVAVKSPARSDSSSIFLPLRAAQGGTVPRQVPAAAQGENGEHHGVFDGRVLYLSQHELDVAEFLSPGPGRCCRRWQTALRSKVVSPAKRGRH